MRMFCSLPVPLSLAVTCRIPFASISKVTSTCGTPRGAGGIPSRYETSEVLLCFAIGRSPCNTLISTLGWLSLAVEKRLDFLVGIVVLDFDQLGDYTTHCFDTQRKWGNVQQQYIFHFTCQYTTLYCSTNATTSSGFTPLVGFLPKNFSTSSCTLGIRVEPPTSITSLISASFRPASFNAFLQGFSVRSNKVSASCSNFARVNFLTRCFGIPSTAVIYGRLISVSCERKVRSCFFSSFFQTLQSHRIFSQIYCFIFLEFFCQPVDDHLIKVITTKVGITVGRFYFKYAIAQFQDRNIEMYHHLGRIQRS